MNLRLIREKTVIFQKSKTIPDTKTYFKNSALRHCSGSLSVDCIKYFILGCDDNVLFPGHAVIKKKSMKKLMEYCKVNILLADTNKISSLSLNTQGRRGIETKNLRCYKLEAERNG